MRQNLHASAVLIDGVGIAIFGASGTGKTLLALDLINHAGLSGSSGILIADDRVEFVAAGEGVEMHAPPALAGKLELRGRGIVELPFRSPAPLGLVVELVETLERMPADSAFTTTLLERPFPRCPVPRRGVIDPQHQLHLVTAALRLLPGHTTSWEKNT